MSTPTWCWCSSMPMPTSRQLAGGPPQPCLRHAALTLEVLPSHQLFQLAIRNGTGIEFSELHEQRPADGQRRQSWMTPFGQALAPMRGNRSISRSIWTGLTRRSAWHRRWEPGGYNWSDFRPWSGGSVPPGGRRCGGTGPTTRHNGISSVLAAKVTRSLLLLRW